MTGWASIVVPLIAALLGSGIWQAAAAWLRGRRMAKPEADSLTVATAERSLSMSAKIADDLAEDNARLRTQMEDQQQKIDGLVAQMAGLAETVATQRDLLAVERSARQRIERMLDHLKGIIDDDRAWIRRTIDRIHAEHPEAWPALQPLPDYITDPGFPGLRPGTSD